MENTLGIEESGVMVAETKDSMVLSRTADAEVGKYNSTLPYELYPTQVNLLHVTPKTCDSADSQTQLDCESCKVPRKLSFLQISQKTPGTDVNCSIEGVKAKIAPRKLFGSPYSTGIPVKGFEQNTSNLIETGTRIKVHSRLPKISRAVVDKCVQKIKVNTLARKLGFSPALRQTFGTDTASEILVPKLNEVITQLNVSSTVRKNFDLGASRSVSKSKTNSILTQLKVSHAAARRNNSSEIKNSRSNFESLFPQDDFSFVTVSTPGKSGTPCDSNRKRCSRSPPRNLPSTYVGTTFIDVGPSESWAKFCLPENTNCGLYSKETDKELNFPCSFASTPRRDLDQCRKSPYFKPKADLNPLPTPLSYFKASVAGNRENCMFKTNEIQTNLSAYAENSLKLATEFTQVCLSNSFFIGSNESRYSDQSDYRVCNGTPDTLSSTITVDPLNSKSFGPLEMLTIPNQSATISTAPYSLLCSPTSLLHSSICGTFSNALASELCSGKNYVSVSEVPKYSEKSLLKETTLGKQKATSKTQDYSSETEVEETKDSFAYLMEIEGYF